MQKINDGGPAFPSTRKVGSVELADGGMTLRDYFAAKAPVDFGMVAALWGDDQISLHDDRTRAAFIAVWAMLRYEWADAMLAASEKNEQQA